MESVTVIQERDIVGTPVRDFAAVYVGDARKPLFEARICAAQLSLQQKPKFLLIDVGAKPDQEVWDQVAAAVHRQSKAP